MENISDKWCYLLWGSRSCVDYCDSLSKYVAAYPTRKSQQKTKSISKFISEFAFQILLCKDTSFLPTTLGNPPEIHSCIFP